MKNIGPLKLIILNCIRLNVVIGKKKKRVIVGSGNMNSRRKKAIFFFSVGCECYESVC